MRRFLLHHVPLALASAGLLALFMAAPPFGASKYRHADVASAEFPRVQSEAPATGRVSGHRAESIGGANERHERRDHHGVQGGPMQHAGHDAARQNHAGASLSSEDRTDVIRSRNLQQFTVASGYLALILLAATLLLGPANLVLRRRNPISTYLRREDRKSVV